jgi:citrate synthase
MSNTAKLELDGKVYELPVVVGSRAKRPSISAACDRKRAGSPWMTAIRTPVPAERRHLHRRRAGHLRYRGIPIEELAEGSTFVETAYLIIFGHLPNSQELRRFSDQLTEHELIHEDMKYHFEGFPSNAHPMAILSSMINATACFYPECMSPYDPETFETEADAPHLPGADHRGVCLPQIAGPADHLPEAGLQIHRQLPAHDVLQPYEDYELKPEVVKALD